MISHIAQKVLLTETMLICCWVALIRNADATVLVTLLRCVHVVCAVPRQDSMSPVMLSCLGTATDLLDIPRQMTRMNPACTCRIV